MAGEVSWVPEAIVVIDQLELCNDPIREIVFGGVERSVLVERVKA
jgi:hypothetical protein